MNSADFLGDLILGFARLLDAADIGVTWTDPPGTYTAGQTGIGLMSFPLGINRAVALSPYGLGDDATLAITEVGLQIKMRSTGADPRDVWALDSAISGYLLGNWPMDLPTGISIHVLEGGSSGSLGQDANDRWQWVHNYPLNVYRPTPERA